MTKTLRSSRAVVWAVLPWAALVGGCASHSENLQPVRAALDAGQISGAVALLNRELEVKDADQLPAEMGSDRALLVLDRALLQQSLVRWKGSQRDYQAADKAIDLLDLTSNLGDTIAEYMFSGSSAKYKAPPYEKLGINTLNMVNYLEQGDLGGGRVEARRLGVYTDYYRNKLKEPSPMLALGGFLAGFILEKAGDVDGALHYYDDALTVGSFAALEASARDALPRGSYKTQRLQKAAGAAPPRPPLEETGEGELLVLCGYGRVPLKIANRVPIGLALTFAAPYLSPGDIASARSLAAQGAVTWVNYPSLEERDPQLEAPRLAIGGQAQILEEAVDVTTQVRSEWKRVEGGIMAAAITRTITRVAVGVGAQAAGAASGSDEGRIIGLLAGLFAQATLTALDKPDTRSWETLPAKVAVARIRLPEGRHEIVVSSRGMTRRQPVTIKRGSWAAVSLFAPR